MTPAPDHFTGEELSQLGNRLVLYRCALRLVETQLTNLNEFYLAGSDPNPIEHIKSRMKSAESIAHKLALRGLPVTAESAADHLTDIAGARIICCYAKDIADIATILKSHRDLTVVTEKDYVTHPKPSGYRSYHLVVRVTPDGAFGDRSVPVEIQIRTAAMDFWASLEHRVRYKYDGDIPEHLSAELRASAEKTHELDNRLYLIHELVDLINA
ncbi:MAG: GTP pyrophosphokinase family protein [Propionibacteriaceae bacterium]|nr:GTP pyrophosphokinase family protein [Propionibacteriaceae bacterium]